MKGVESLHLILGKFGEKFTSRTRRKLKRHKSPIRYHNTSMKNFN